MIKICPSSVYYILLYAKLSSQEYSNWEDGEEGSVENDQQQFFLLKVCFSRENHKQ